MMLGLAERLLYNIIKVHEILEQYRRTILGDMDRNPADSVVWCIRSVTM